MPSASSFARRRTHRSAPFVAITLLIAFAASIVNTRVAFACPEERMPLRSLYINSDLVVVARVGRLVPVQLVDSNDEENYRQYLTRRDLRVDSTLKGEPNQSVIPLYSHGWGYDGDIQDDLSEYDTQKLLLFLTKREDGGGYEIDNAAAGIKKLSDGDLKVYVERLKELDHIVQQGDPDPALIVEWLVRCAEEPATRWEGLQELSMSFYTLRSDAATDVTATAPDNAETNAPVESESGEANHAGADPPPEVVESGNANESGSSSSEPTSEAMVEDEVVPRGFSPDYGPDLVRLLTEDQKRRLSNVFFNAKKLTYDELMLLEAVRAWDEPRVVAFIMSQLRGFAENPPPEVEILVNIVADSLKDEEVVRLAATYCKNSSYSDETEDAGVADQSQVEVESAADGQAEAQAEPADATPDNLQDDLTVIGTDREKRSLRLGRFINRAEYLLMQ